MGGSGSNTFPRRFCIIAKIYSNQANQAAEYEAFPEATHKILAEMDACLQFAPENTWVKTHHADGKYQGAHDGECIEHGG